MKTLLKYILTLCALLTSASFGFCLHRDSVVSISSPAANVSDTELSVGSYNHTIITTSSSCDDELEAFYIEEEEDEDEKDSFKRPLGANESKEIFFYTYSPSYLIQSVDVLTFTERFVHFLSLRSLNIEFSVFRI